MRGTSFYTFSSVVRGYVHFSHCRVTLCDSLSWWRFVSPLLKRQSAVGDVVMLPVEWGSRSSVVPVHSGG